MPVGFFSVIGSLASGATGQRYSKPIFLTPLIDLARSIAVTAFLPLPDARKRLAIGARALPDHHGDGAAVGSSGAAAARVSMRW